MKKDRKIIKLEKIEIAKISNLNNIYGGATHVGGGCGTDGPNGNQQQPKCKENSDIIIGTDTNEI